MPKVGMPEIRKPQLINATMEAINAVGLQKASVVMISSYAGVSPAIINHYFGGKSGLLEATMRSVLKQLSEGVKSRLQDVGPDDVVARIQAIVGGNFSTDQMDSKVVKTWLAFWSQSMHDEALFRLQRVNEKRLLSHLSLELKKILPADKAVFVAQGIAALIDGIWLRGALSPQGINAELAQRMITDYLALQLA
ncbi:transcriptional regulator BetI [Amphritea atlantica]|uniref:HTH-type transcriptional regulator BetI n=1 Tax=Amphritea atlantica TaxID=355243 RepID=A0ABY5GQ60_9GAMM|nr:transcriptional regulator BetI [Amphritea atlantica]